MSTSIPSLSEAARAVRALEAEFERHANAANAADLTEAFYVEDAQLLPPNAPVVTGKKAIREFWAAFLATGLSDVSLETGAVSASGDLAWGVGKYGYTASGVRQTGKYLVVYRRQPNGNYKAVADMFSGNA
jgi:ketosteroid isomerase-like protein